MKKLIWTAFMCAVLSMLVSCSGKENETMSDHSLTPTVAATVTPQPTQAVTPKPTPIVDYTGKKLVALTFDDGPNATTTPMVLDKLEKYGVVASFFLIGQNIDVYMKRIMERQVSLGCELNNHSWSHPSMSTMTAKEIKKQIKDTDDKIYEMVGVKPKFFRPPYIAVSNTMYENIDLPFICGVGCNDWDSTVTTQQRVDTILSSIEDGEIILLHDSANNINTVNALDQIIPKLLDKGYAFVTVSKLFELKGINPDEEYHIWTNVNESIEK